MSEPTLWREAKDGEAAAQHICCDAYCANGFSAFPLIPVAAGALLIERPETLRWPILDLVANELLTQDAATNEIMRLLIRESAGHTHWFIDTARGERCEKCGVARAACGEGT